MLRRAAAAIHESGSSDCLVLARRALEAAVRCEGDLVALLPPATARRRSVTSSDELTSERADQFHVAA
jgi:hypothetical protein